MTKRMLQKSLRPYIYYALLALLVLGRMLIAYSQRVYLMPQGSALDDALMVRGAQSLVQGGWLGAYGGYTIAKNMGFALWLAALNLLKIPMLWANAALWIAAAWFGAWALKPVFTGNISRLVVFAFFAYQPVSYAQFTLRAYRDAIFPSMCMLFFAGILGFGLRTGIKSLKGSVFSLLVSGFGLMGAWLLREDGATLLPFAVCGTGAILLFFVFNKEIASKTKRMLISVIPFGVLAVGILAFSAANMNYYGVFTVNDMTTKYFTKAYGSLVAVSEAESGWQRYTPVTQKALEKMYNEIPSLKKLEPALKLGPAFSGFTNEATGEFGGSFYFALRIAAQLEGLTPTATQARTFWQTLERETAKAVAEGRLKSLKPRATTVPSWNNQLLGPTLAETARGTLYLLNFADCDARPLESEGEDHLIDEMAAFLHSKVQRGYAQGTDQPYFNPLQKIMFLITAGLVWLYRVVIWALLGLAFAAMGKDIGYGIKTLRKNKKYDIRLLLGILQLGLVLSALLRIAVAGYMEVAAFKIGTYIMYLSPAMPPVLLFAALGTGLFMQRFSPSKTEEPCR